MENNTIEQNCTDCASSILDMAKYNDYEVCLEFLESQGIFQSIVTCNECGKAAKT